MPKRDAAVKGDFYVSDITWDLWIFSLVMNILFAPVFIILILLIPKLRPLERKLLDVVSDHMSEEDQKRLKLQLRENNTSTRSGGMTTPENIFQQWYLIPFEPFSFHPFVDAPGHFILLATVKFKLDGKTVTFDLFSLEGVLFSLRFKSLPFNDGRNEYRTDIEILSVDTEPVVLDEHGKFLRFANEG
ncbi:MAG: hypothetical protein ABJG80_17720 [Paracoccaceae bacterium]